MDTLKRFSTERNLRVLVIDDTPKIHEDFRKILCGENLRSPGLDQAEAVLLGEDAGEALPGNTVFDVDSASQGEEGIFMVQKALDQGRPYAMAFVDVRMPPGLDGIKTVAEIWKRYPELQVVICTAYSDYSWGEIAKQLGASENLVILKKPFDSIEVLQLAHAMTTKWMVTKQANARLEDLSEMVRERTAELSAANERFSKAFQASPLPMVICKTTDGQFLDVNESFCTLFEWKRQNVIGQSEEELKMWADVADRTEFWAIVQQDRRVVELRCRVKTRTGAIREALAFGEEFRLNQDRCVLMLFYDITDRVKLEEELRQSQKMEAVGQLAAGVAHDFNNLLTIIRCHAELRLAAPSEDPVLNESLQHIATASDRAASLTRQLLAFGRRQVIQPISMNLNELVRSMQQMIQSLLGEDVRLECALGQGITPVRADRWSVEQVLVNIIVNSADAMPQGGQLSIVTANVEIDKQQAAHHPDANPGSYVCISVADTGCGMEPEVLSRIFEPFFTTKPIGNGSGMGLAVVYGIVKQHDGWIHVDSVVGHGTNFQIYLPASLERIEMAPPAPETTAPKGGNETILVVEDNVELCAMAAKVLASAGYRVHCAGCGADALKVWSDREGKIDLLFSDIVMPGRMSGSRLAEKLRALKPELRVVLTSGHGPKIKKCPPSISSAPFMSKPYSTAALLATVRSCLDSEQLPADCSQPSEAADLLAG